MASESKIVPETTRCIFCGASNADAPLKVDLYKIIRRENKYVVVAIQCQTRYQKTSIEVPRCQKCQQSHDRLGLVGLIPAVAVLIAAVVIGVIWLWQLWNAGELEFGVVFGLVIGVILVGYMGLAAVGLFFMIVEFIADCLGFNTERRAREVQPIKSMLADGWELGEKPPYKGDNVNT